MYITIVIMAADLVLALKIEFDGVIHQFNYDKELRQDEKIIVANIIFENGNLRFNLYYLLQL